MSLQQLATQVRSKGRGPDTELVHMTAGEVDGLHALARSMYGKNLPINPETGLHEAGWLKSILPTLAGAAANYFLPGSGALVGAATGALTNKDNPLMGAVGGYFGGQGGSDILSALNTAGAGGARAVAGGPEQLSGPGMGEAAPAAKMEWGNVSKGLQGLATSEGRDALAAAASKDGKAGYGGIMMAGLKALAPTILAGDMSSSGSGGGAGDPRKQYKPTYRTERVYAGGQKPEGAPETSEGEWFQYNRVPINNAAGGAIGYADGGAVDNRTDSQKAFDYLMGKGSLDRRGGQTVTLDPKPGTPAAPGTPGTPQVPVDATGTGSSGNPGSGEGGGADTGVGTGLGGSDKGTDSTSGGISSIGMGFGVPGANPDVSGKLAGTIGGLVAGLPGVLAGQALAAGYNNLNATQNAIAQSIAHMAELQDAAAVDAAAAAGADGTLGAPGSADVGSGMGGVAGPGAGTAAGDAAGNTEGSGGQTSNAGIGAGIAGQGDVGYDSGSNSVGGGYGGDSGGIGGGPGGADGAAGDAGSSDSGSTGGGSDTGGAAGSGGDGTGSGGDTGGGGGDWAEGGIVGLQSGGFVFPADVVSAVGAGSSSAGLETLAKKFGARPVSGKGHGQSDHIPAVIDGKQPARVARDEAILDAAQVAKIGGGDPKKGAKKLYDMMARVRKQSMGRNKQMRPITSAALR